MRVTIANDDVVFVSDSHGAEVHSLHFADEEIDYLWMPPEPGPASVSTCFPLLGRLPDGRYELEGREYEMGIHGFVGDTDLEVVERTDDSVTYGMSDDAETLAAYPFRFRFRVRYALEGATLVTQYLVDNPGEVPLLYSVGSHPRFACPVDPAEGLGFTDHHLTFDRPEGPRKVVRTFGPRELVDDAFSADGHRLGLDPAQFPDGAFCLGGLDSERVVLGSDRSRRALAMEMPGVSFLQVWNMPGSPFVALEAWYGAISGNPMRAEDGVWDRRPGTLSLAPGGTARHAFRVTPIR